MAHPTLDELLEGSAIPPAELPASTFKPIQSNCSGNEGYLHLTPQCCFCGAKMEYSEGIGASKYACIPSEAKYICPDCRISAIREVGVRAAVR